MGDHREFIRESIIRDMSEGVMTIGFDGIVTYLNPAAEKILARKTDEIVGQPFALCFFDYPENDNFSQTILDAAYDRDHTHENAVSYTHLTLPTKA